VTYPELAQLTAESIDAYFRSGVPTTHRLSATPVCELLIDPSADTYELLTPAVGAEPDLTGMQRVTVDTLALEDGTYFRLRIDARDLRYEAYGLVISVVQAMRGGASFAAATGAALTNLRTILAARRRLSPDQQTGLLGELMLVRRLLDLHAEQDVIEWWLGPMAEQHDFAFPGVDVEVKTTTAERRIHVIHGTGQLRPNPHRPLWLLSIQVTRAGGAEGVSLTGLVDAVRARLDTRREAFLQYLVGLGWRDNDSDLYRDRYLLRSDPLAYLVDEDFPAITDERLAVSVPHTDLVSAVTYRVDVTSRTPDQPGAPVDEFLEDTGVAGAEGRVDE
jgi:hypothetical protein